MMRISLSLLVAIAVLASTTLGFAPTQKTSRVTSSLSAAYLPAVQVNVAAVQTPLMIQQSSSSNPLLTEGLQNYMAASSIESSTQALSLKERPPPPTKEELEIKKRNFNYWFWGGGFAAPTLATFYYFGFKFWER
jgi:hypothetical protein